MIDAQKFLEIIDATPLVSIDLIVEDEAQNILLGKRVNRPAQGFWFVPGGRINKNEKIADAIERISMKELDYRISLAEAELLGTYDHIYDDNFHGVGGINTHYVVLAYKVCVADRQAIGLDEQHSEIMWCPVDALMADETVHPNTRAYFRR